jgi:hypothetical protein
MDNTFWTLLLMKDIKILITQNERLKEALLKLKDLSVLEKQQRDLQIKELEKRIETIPQLESTLFFYISSFSFSFSFSLSHSRFHFHLQIHKQTDK